MRSTCGSSRGETARSSGRERAGSGVVSLAARSEATVDFLWTWERTRHELDFVVDEELDRSVLEAAADLGATPAQRFYKVTLPLTKGGMLSGSVLVFVPTLGEFLIPELLGGAKVMMLGKFIALKITGLRHWPLGAAFSLLLLSIILLLLFVSLRLGGGKEAFQEQGL